MDAARGRRTVAHTPHARAWCSLALALAGLARERIARADPPPSTMLWAWERSEDLRGVGGAGGAVGVAFLAETVGLREGRALGHPRRQPLRVAPGTYLLAVVRVEREGARPEAHTAAQRQAIVEAVLHAWRQPGVRGVQLDFDAVRSERDFHREVLRALRGALPPGAFLSVTALASWCVGDRWLGDGDLPVDEVVPMLFAMGAQGPALLRALAARGDFPEARCRSSVGWSVGGARVALPAGRRTYWFAPRGWSAEAVRAVLHRGSP